MLDRRQAGRPARPGRHRQARSRTAPAELTARATATVAGTRPPPRPSDKQLDLIKRLAAERDYLSLGDTQRKLVEDVCTGTVISKRSASDLISALMVTVPADSRSLRPEFLAKVEQPLASPKQVDFIKRLLAERGADAEKLVTVDLAEMTKAQASALIDALFKIKAQPKAMAQREVEPGLYRNADGVIVKAYKARQHDGILAARLDVTAEKPWIYLGMAHRFVTDEFTRMTLSEAIAFGKTAIDGKFYCCSVRHRADRSQQPGRRASGHGAPASSANRLPRRPGHPGRAAGTNPQTKETRAVGETYSSMEFDRDLMIKDGLPRGAAEQLALQHAREQAVKREAEQHPGWELAEEADTGRRYSRPRWNWRPERERLLRRAPGGHTAKRGTPRLARPRRTGTRRCRSPRSAPRRRAGTTSSGTSAASARC